MPAVVLFIFDFGKLYIACIYYKAQNYISSEYKKKLQFHWYVDDAANYSSRALYKNKHEHAGCCTSGLLHIIISYYNTTITGMYSTIMKS